jgi:pimeloyl-ACP methyl ester carboxylesterase
LPLLETVARAYAGATGAQYRRPTVRVAILAASVVLGAGCSGGDDEVQPSAVSASDGATTASEIGVEATLPHAVTSDATSGIDEMRTVGDHRELDIGFVSDGTSLAGTLFLPERNGSYPALVWVHASGEHERLHYGDLVAAVLRSGVAFFSYDKRGVGESGGRCCPADDEDAGDAEFGEQAGDAVAALEAVRAVPQIDPGHVGYLGVSQAGWIVPIAATRSSDVAFVVLVSAATVTTGEEQFYSQLTGDADQTDEQQRVELSRQLAEHGPSGFDPAPYLADMTVPALWLFGSADGSIPTVDSEAVLDRVKAEGKDFSYVVFDGAGHGLLDDSPPPPPDVVPTIVEWVAQHVG